ncbi:MAG: sulfotransferase, partial [Octadecabacter sp.]|nr:sulfotransferase [Octadecabacter sp.]
MPDDTLPRVFVIGLPMNGGADFKQLFEANGYLWRHRQGGKLACDIAYSKATGDAPLRPWGKAVGFSGLDRTDRKHLPPIEAWREFRYLHAHFPDAYFINPHGDPADWVARRYFTQSGTTRDIEAWHRGVSEDALPELWLEDLVRHRAECAEYFAGNPRFIDLNMATQGLDYAIEKLSSHFDLGVSPEATPITCTPDQIREVLNHMEHPQPQSAAARADPLFADHVAAHCLGTKGHHGPARALGQTAVQWSDAGFTDREGAPVGMAQNENRVLLAQGQDRYERSQAALDEFLRHGGTPPVWVDMMDARFVGSQGNRKPPRNTLAYNRRTGASNLVLWPLPGYHTFEPRGAPGGYPVDDIPFADKADTCAWLGNMT